MKKLFDGIMAGAMPLELIIILRVWIISSSFWPTFALSIYTVENLQARVTRLSMVS